MKLLSYGQAGIVIPLDDAIGSILNETDNAGNLNKHVNMLTAAGNDKVIYLPGNSDQAANMNYFNKNDNIIIEEIQWHTRGADWIKEWIKDFGFTGEFQLSDGTYLQAMPYFGSFGGGGAPHYEQMRYIPPVLRTNLFFNTHTPGQALNTRFVIDYELSFKTAGTDLRAFFNEMVGDDYKTHSLYINIVFAFRHTLPVTLIP
jgi:hypothetical protein